MSDLNSKSPSEFVNDLLHVSNSNSGRSSASTTVIEDGSGDTTALAIGASKVVIKPSADTTALLDIQNASGNSMLKVDATNNKIYTGSTPINTQVKTFDMDFNWAFPTTTNNTALASAPLTATPTEWTMGSGATPTTVKSFSANGQDLVPYLWYVPYNIEIDSVKAVFSNDTATGDTVVFTLMSYAVDKNNASTSGDLSDGAVVALSVSQITSGYEQIYFKDLAVATGAVSAGRAVVAFVRQGSNNSDLQAELQIFYHFT